MCVWVLVGLCSSKAPPPTSETTTYRSASVASLTTTQSGILRNPPHHAGRTPRSHRAKKCTVRGPTKLPGKWLPSYRASKQTSATRPRRAKAAPSRPTGLGSANLPAQQTHPVRPDRPPLTLRLGELIFLLEAIPTTSRVPSLRRAVAGGGAPRSASRRDWTECSSSQGSATPVLQC